MIKANSACLMFIWNFVNGKVKYFQIVGIFFHLKQSCQKYFVGLLAEVAHIAKDVTFYCKCNNST